MKMFAKPWYLVSSMIVSGPTDIAGPACLDSVWAEMAACTDLVTFRFLAGF
jgi:hypothetical protein